MNNLYCLLYAFSFSIQVKNMNFALTFCRSFIKIFAWGAFWWSIFHTLTKLWKFRIAWRELIYRDTFRDRFWNRCSLVRHLYGSIPMFDFANLGRQWLCPGDFSREVYPRSFVCSTYFSSHENITLHFASSRFRCSILFVDHNILENTCCDDSHFIIVR